MKKLNKTLLQCDFDGTITEGDISFLILDHFAEGDWRTILKEYQKGRITVGDFNNRAFALVKQPQKTLESFVMANGRIRDGLGELVSYCSENGIKLVVVSNGLDFYIRTLLGKYNCDNIEINAARTVFTDSGIDARYYNHHGEEVLSEFKESYTRKFISGGYRVFYAGNGPSDIPASRLASHTFATETLEAYYREKKLAFTPFEKLTQVTEGLKKIL
ncbi:HAD-superfamily hydrolase, subfamily IB (PSPase-like) [Dehalogenimonas lykanthroporepellens BL-DC-9]|nr:HAD-superfamily hydrolase, subfamily IB (PSPase-like) [Dehalogenimonas lykanthroporepellens BL-DC-9]